MQDAYRTDSSSYTMVKRAAEHHRGQNPLKTNCSQKQKFLSKNEIEVFFSCCHVINNFGHKSFQVSLIHTDKFKTLEPNILLKKQEEKQRVNVCCL